MSEISFEPLTSRSQLEEGYHLLLTLRQGLSFSEFSATYEKAKAADEYTLLAGRDGRNLVGVMGYRVLHDFVHGTHLYVDDLVVSESQRSKGIGAQFLREAERIAHAKKCRALRLCTGVENQDGIRFYEREGWAPRALAFKKSALTQ